MYTEKCAENISMKNTFKHTGLFKQNISYDSIAITINTSIY